MILKVSFAKQVVLNFVFTAAVTVALVSLFPSLLTILFQFHPQNLHIVVFTFKLIHLAFSDLATLRLYLSSPR